MVVCGERFGYSDCFNHSVFILRHVLMNRSTVYWYACVCVGACVLFPVAGASDGVPSAGGVELAGIDSQKW